MNEKIWPISTVRVVHAQRARKLRKKGHAVRIKDVSLWGRTRYEWMPGFSCGKQSGTFAAGPYA